MSAHYFLGGARGAIGLPAVHGIAVHRVEDRPPVRGRRHDLCWTRSSATSPGTARPSGPGPGRRSHARRAVFVEAANQPTLRHEITRAQQDIADWMAPLLAQLGSIDPTRDVQHLLALMDGLVGNQLASRRPNFDPTTAVGALLDGLIDCGRRT